MGIHGAVASLLVKEASRRPFEGAVATLGRQHVYFTFEEFRRRAAALGMELAPARVTLHREPALAAQEFISDGTFLAALGFSQVVRLDCSDYEAADALVDLNSADTPAELVGRFDVVLDSGTLEHVFHLPHALRHIGRMLKCGGRVVHLTPASNYLDHGFWMVSPTLFWDYYAANAWQLNTIQLVRWDPRHARRPWLVYDYQPQWMSDEVASGGLDAGMYAVHVVATRTADSTNDRIPQQGAYLERWRQGQARPVSVEDGKAGRLLALTAGSPRLQAAARRLIACWRAARQGMRSLVRRRGPQLKVVARY